MLEEEYKFLSYQEQLSLLKKRGLYFKDDALALNMLERASYYRLSTYWYPFLDLKFQQDKKFKKNTDFDAVIKLYEFDAKLRKIVMAELGNIEVAIRSQIVYALSSAYGSFWLGYKDLFSDFEKYENTIKSIEEEVKRSRESFIVSFRNKYPNKLPPAYMAKETMSFGTLSRLYKILKLARDKQKISHFFGLSGETLGSWLHSLSYVRNICAHHARLWNIQLGVSPKDYECPQGVTKRVWLENNSNCKRIYIILSIMIYLLNAINPGHFFKQELKKLFTEYPDIDKVAMGFPDDWQKEALWI